MFGLGTQKMRFPFTFFVYEVEGSEFCMSVYHHIRQLVAQEFFQQGLIFLENDKNWFSFVFTVLPNHIKIKSPLKYKSVCGRMVMPSGLSTALASHNRSITCSSLDGARFTQHFFL